MRKKNGHQENLWTWNIFKTPVRKWASVITGHFSGEDMQMADKHMQKHSTPLDELKS